VLGQWVQFALPHLKRWNARATEWAAEASWKRIALLGLVVFIACLIVGSILGLDEPTVIVTGSDKPIKIDINEDPSGITLQPLVGGKKLKSTHIPVPPEPPSSSGTSEHGKASHGDGSLPEIETDKDGVRFEKNGKKYVIDSHGVHVYDTSKDTDAAKAGAEGDDAAKAVKGKSDEQDQDADAVSRKADAQEREHDIEEARADRKQELRDAIDEAKDDLRDAIAEEVASNSKRTTVRRESAAFWDFFKVLLTVSFAYLIAIKVSSRNKRRADEMVKSAAQVAEHESLQRQVVEARMQMMQAQVEPHFLFNTLSSVDYLIETDPARASTMQKNLIQYLRAALPQMREASTTLGREVDLVRAYLDILKVRMEERLQIQIQVPEGLRSADFPPMMLQSLVENAIKHGLEPKAEGGAIRVLAEVADGDLYVTIADTGLGFNPAGASTSGGGVGLSNIRERLALLYGGRAKFIITANEPSGTRVAIVIPYQPAARRS
jgi:hypothetical protein